MYKQFLIAKASLDPHGYGAPLSADDEAFLHLLGLMTAQSLEVKVKGGSKLFQFLVLRSVSLPV